MDVDAPKGPLRYFAQLPDPRVNRRRRHLLPDIGTVAICAVICGADGWVQVAEFGRCKVKWFQTFLALPNGIPSHDTFGRGFAALDPRAFEECFRGACWRARLGQGGRSSALRDVVGARHVLHP